MRRAPSPGGLTRPCCWKSTPTRKNVGWVGIVSVEFGSRIDTTQLLLNRAFILMAGLLAGVLAFFTFYFITTRLILQPVRVLQETAEKVSRGRPEHPLRHLHRRRVPATLRDLQRDAGQPQGRTPTPCRPSTRAWTCGSANWPRPTSALYESNRLKSEFLANVSHELRTPLNSILGFADLLKDALSPPPSDRRDDGRTPRQLRYVHNIRQSGRNLLDLINDLLDLAKIEAGRMEIRSEPLSLSDLFEGLATILKPLAEQKGVIDRAVGVGRRADPAQRPGQAPAGAVQPAFQRDQVLPRRRHDRR